MDINKSAENLQNALEKLRDDSDTWKPTEIRVLPSGDEMDHIKIWLNFPDQDAAALEDFKQVALDSLTKSHGAIVEEFKLEIRADAD
jgi:hypothetical protein